MEKIEFVHVNGIRIEDWVFDVIKIVEKELQVNGGETLCIKKQRELLRSIAAEVIKVGTTVNMPLFLDNFAHDNNISDRAGKCAKCGELVLKPHSKFEVCVCKCGEHYHG
ncbi:hypothetical protein [Bacillus cereus]|uniref:hypothetical protein n=1 Tax=Bacillus cereus TaxID=1396 RepID=UPI000530BEA8|nr:hypothetical protein [Bacillus cereus]KGT40603.1 hypothetical protein IY08_29510 [Bacillus cereus]